MALFPVFGIFSLACAGYSYRHSDLQPRRCVSLFHFSNSKMSGCRFYIRGAQLTGCVFYHLPWHELTAWATAGHSRSNLWRSRFGWCLQQLLRWRKSYAEMTWCPGPLYLLGLQWTLVMWAVLLQPEQESVLVPWGEGVLSHLVCTRSGLPTSRAIRIVFSQ